jgi:hypothetical protein
METYINFGTQTYKWLNYLHRAKRHYFANTPVMLSF